MERYVLRGFLVHTYYLPVLGSNLVSHPGGRAPSSDEDIALKNPTRIKRCLPDRGKLQN